MKRPTGIPYRELEKAIHEDADYAWSWHCNIAVPLMDNLECSHLDANRTAAALMRHLFGTDTSKHSNFPK